MAFTVSLVTQNRQKFRKNDPFFSGTVESLEIARFGIILENVKFVSTCHF